MKLRKIAAAAAALIVASQVAAVGVSAETVYLGGNGVWYSTSSAAQHVGGTGVARDSSELTEAERSSIVRYDPGSSSATYSTYYSSYSELTHRWYTSYNAALAASGNNKAMVSGGNVYTDTTYSSYYPYYSTVTGYYYHNYNDALAASNGNSASVAISSEYGSHYVTNYNYSSTYGYYSSYTGKWYSNYNDALKASNYNSNYVTTGYYNGYNYNNGYGYYSSYTGRWYSSYDDALRASNYNSSYVSSGYYNGYNYNNGYGYYSSYTGRWYSTYSEAVRASNGNSAYVSGGYYNNGYYGTDSYYYNYYYYPYIYAYGSTGYYYGNDANYYSYMAWRNRSNKSDSDSTKVSSGVPYIKNYKKYNGWDTIAKLAKDAKSNQSLIIMMNGAEVVPENVISAIKGRNVSLRFMLDNGSYWTINGTNLTSAQQFDTYIEYNINFIPAKLKNKAKKGSVAQYQVGLTNSFSSVGGKYSVTLPLPAERGSRIAKIYLYDKEGKKLRGVATSVIDSDGKLTFSVTEGGAYYIVVK